MVISLKHRLKDRLPNRAQCGGRIRLTVAFSSIDDFAPIFIADADLLHKAHPDDEVLLSNQPKHPGLIAQDRDHRV